MKILFISGDLCDGGAQRVTSVIANEFAMMGHEVYLLVFSHSDRDYYVNNKVELTYMCKNIDEYNEKNNIQNIVYVRKYIKNVKPDVGIGFLQGGYALYFASLGMRFPKIASARVTPNLILEAKGLNAEITKYWFRHASAVVVQNNSQLEQIQNVSWKNKTVIANPLSEKAMRMHIQKYNDSCNRFVMAGRLSKQKNYFLVAEAMKKVHSLYPDVTVDIFGQGALHDQLEQEIVSNGLEGIINLKGWTDNIIGELINYDAYILASDFEGMPNSLMEAMSVGLPCISTDCETGPRELIKNMENGILVPTNDSDKMANAIINLVNMKKSERAGMGEMASKNMRELFNPRAIAEKWENLCNKLIKN